MRGQLSKATLRIHQRDGGCLVGDDRLCDWVQLTSRHAVQVLKYPYHPVGTVAGQIAGYQRIGHQAGDFLSRACLLEDAVYEVAQG